MDGGTWTTANYAIVGDTTGGPGLGFVNQSAGTVDVNGGWMSTGLGSNGATLRSMRRNTGSRAAS